eukprot:16847-Heterococcus_DN1.PRE.1
MMLVCIDHRSLLKTASLENLPPPGKAVIFLPNHTSYMDVPVTGFLPRLVKYLTKAELAYMPIIGWKAVMAGDILVQRQSARTFKRLIAQTAASLRAGNCLVAFPEGTRSKDGKLSSFKKGPFLMAQKAKQLACSEQQSNSCISCGCHKMRLQRVIVPVTITGVAEAMPPSALAPIRKPKNVVVQLHPAIDPAGRDLGEVMREARKAVASVAGSAQVHLTPILCAHSSSSAAALLSSCHTSGASSSCLQRHAVGHRLPFTSIALTIYDQAGRNDSNTSVVRLALLVTVLLSHDTHCLRLQLHCGISMMCFNKFIQTFEGHGRPCEVARSCKATLRQRLADTELLLCALHSHCPTALPPVVSL